MKKFGLVAALVLTSLSVVFAAPIADTTGAPVAAAEPADVNHSVVVNAYLAGYLTLSNMTSRHDFMLNAAGGTEAVATARIATNLKNWDLTLASSEADTTSAALVNDESDRIPYTVTLIGGTNGGTAFVAGTNLTSSTVTKKGYTNRLSGGANGEEFTLSITYGAEDATKWFSNKTYTDTLTITVAAR